MPKTRTKSRSCTDKRRHAGDVDHPGNLPDYCPKAGPRRNRAMVCLGADVCVAFFKKGAANYGTAGCVKLAKAAGIDVRPWSA
jgi:hypothetical protein